MAGTRDAVLVPRVSQQETRLPLTNEVDRPHGDARRGPARSDHPSEPPEGYEWTCPYCSRSQLNKSRGDAGKQNAIAALRAHIQASDGDGHGPRNGFPTEFVALSEHVTKVGD